MKGIMRDTAANVLDFPVCDCSGLGASKIDCSDVSVYTSFIDLLEARPRDATPDHRLLCSALLCSALLLLCYDMLRCCSACQASVPPAGGPVSLRVWLELFPPTEATGLGCLPPLDDARTPWNETSLFDPALGCAAPPSLLAVPHLMRGVSFVQVPGLLRVGDAGGAAGRALPAVHRGQRRARTVT